jgi:hypothetical protein
MYEIAPKTGICKDGAGDVAGGWTNTRPEHDSESAGAIMLYENAPQFNREATRLLGAPPQTDIRQMTNAITDSQHRLEHLRCNELAIPEQFLCSDRFNRNLQKLGVMDGFFRHSTVPTETLIGPTSSTLTHGESRETVPGRGRRYLSPACPRH